MITKHTKSCPSCQTKYVIAWDAEKTDLSPISCPFCANEIDEATSEQDNDSWD